jgi:diguanylate cyclase (GGDEF)-like protein
VPEPEPPTAPHDAAIEQAYLLIESAQGHHDAARVESADRDAAAHRWDDVRLLLNWARSLACIEAAEDDAGYVTAMLDGALALADPSLHALSVAVKAVRTADRRQTTAPLESAAKLFVDAVVLLDDHDPARPVVHRVAALIEVANVAHELGFWELALEYYTLADQALADDRSGRWNETARRQLLVVGFNRCELMLDWSCARAGTGEWEQAGDLARSALASGGPTDSGWPPSWAVQYRGQMYLLAALAGVEAPRPAAENVAAFGAAIRAARAGDHVRAARMAEGPAEHVEVHLPTYAGLLALCLAAKQPGTAPAAIRYGGQLAALRWNDRLDRMAGMRDAIAVERRRHEHEQLRRDLVVDELTGLANRRGYHAYLATLDDAGTQRGSDGTEYAVMMIDVDHFKAVNDGFGHEVGDVVLAHLGEILGAHVRQTDLAARLGGDEFVVILAEVTPGIALLRAQQILESVQTYPWDGLAAGLAVSVSIGVHRGSRRELPILLSDADRNLYQAKKAGRGRVAAG